MNNEYKLIKEIIELSNSKQWKCAKLEWKLEDICIADEPETCLCGHHPIKELCTLINTHNRETVTVGNHCVKKFIGLPSDKIFQSIKKVQKDGNKGLNKDALEYAYKKKWINKWEFKFSIDTMRKRKLSDKQLQTRKDINRKTIMHLQKKN